MVRPRDSTRLTVHVPLIGLGWPAELTIALIVSCSHSASCDHSTECANLHLVISHQHPHTSLPTEYVERQPQPGLSGIPIGLTTHAHTRLLDTMRFAVGVAAVVGVLCAAGVRGDAPTTAPTASPTNLCSEYYQVSATA
jgi:hypothetical protein